jgi:hypothetical protein
VAKILDTCAAIERYVLRRSEDHRLDPALPDEIDIIHACLLGPEPVSDFRRYVLDAKEPIFATTRWDATEAACGGRVRILLPEPFDSEHPKACQRCLDAIGLKGG